MTDLVPSDAPVQAPRGGRNLPAAIAVGLGLLALVGVSLFLVKELFVVVALAAVVASLWELRHAFGRRGITLPLPPLVVGAAGILVSSYVAGEEALLVSFTLTAGGVVVWRTIDSGGASALRDASAGVFAAAWLPLMGGFVMIMLAMPDGARRVLLFVLLAVASDVGGYVAGVLFGRHPLAPSVSPKKTWEGLGGSVLLSCLVGAAGITWLLGGNPLVGVGLGLATVVTATLGDLAESLIKRDLELKDMGTLLPGHGGVLDRLDSLLLTAPVVYLVLLAALPVGD
jgi:phosphatidate cytidylyltransferase